MSSKNWFLRSFPCFAGNPTRSNAWSPRAQRQDRKLAFRLWLEPLEDRAVPAIFTVTNTNDTGAGSFWQTILDANSNGQSDTINFNIAGGGVQTIAQVTPFVSITEALTIDATTQPGYAGKPLIEIDGSAAASLAGFTIASPTTMTGLSIYSFGSTCVRVIAGGSGSVFTSNYFGLRADGTAAPTQIGGIELFGSVSGVVIGGSSVAARNVISNNSAGIAMSKGGDPTGPTGNTILGNFIGTDPTGLLARPNGFGILLNDAVGNTIGDAARGNLISGNTQGIRLSGASETNVMINNVIGLDAAGNALANGTGILIDQAANGNTIGGTILTDLNIISGNTNAGIEISGVGTTNNAILGNFIGILADGTTAGANVTGIFINTGATNNTIGGTTAAARNIISGNTGNGVEITGTGTSGNKVQGNYINLNASGTATFANANADGVYISGGATNNTIGGSAAARNVIAGYTGGIGSAGVAIIGAGTSGNRVQSNSIGTDFTGNAKLGNDIGVFLFADASGNFVGTDGDGVNDAVEGNILSGNASGVWIQLNADNNVVAGNLIGIAADGSTLGNTIQGIRLFDPTVNGTRIGTNADGTSDALERNVISGNGNFGVYDSGAGGTIVAGNYLGTNIAGTAAIGIQLYGVTLQNSANARIGGTTAASRNVVSGNATGGISLTSATTNALIQGNYVGTNAAGTAAVANAAGVLIDGSATGNTVGGNVAGAGNVISGNTNQGVFITANSNTVQGNIIGLNAAGTGKVANNVGIELSANSVLIGTDGNGTNDSNERNVISGNTDVGILMLGGGNHRIAGNYIGTKADGTGGGVGNGNDGIFLQSISGVVIGTDGSNDAFNANERNIISGNGDRGVVLQGTGNVVAGNWIGLDITGASAGTQRFGVQVTGTGSRVGTDANGIADTEERNVISGNTNTGVVMSSTSATVAGNYIGTDSTGLLARPNATGVTIGSGGTLNTIGGTTAAARNIISGNSGSGVSITGVGTSGNLIRGNYIGTDAAGSGVVGNGVGVSINGPVTNNEIGSSTATPGTGAGNVISGNQAQGVLFSSSTGTGNKVQGNIIGLGADGDTVIGNGLGGAANGPGLQVVNSTGLVLIGGVSNLTAVAGGVRNVIAGNPNGDIAIGNGTATNPAIIQGNYLGTDITGTSLRTTSTAILVGSATDLLIGGSGANEGNLIAGGFRGIQISFVSSDGTIIQGNRIGTDKTGTQDIGATTFGIRVSSSSKNTLIGGTTTGAMNLISGNLTGIRIDSNGVGSPTNVLIQGNRIGTKLDGLSALANGTGIELTDGATGVMVGGTVAGASNLISGNIGTGVQITGTGTTGNTIRGNSIFKNTGLGIDLGGDGVTANDTSGHVGPNNYQNFPVLSFIGGGASTNPRGIVNAAANSIYILDFYANTVVDIRGYGQGQRYLGSTTVTTNAVGRTDFSVTLALPTTISEFVSVTATDAAGNTSEFAQSLLADVPPTITLSTPSNALIGITLPFVPVLSDSIPGKTYQSAWSVTFNGSPIALPNAAFVSTGATDQETYFFTPQQVGAYEVSVTVTDSRGGVTTAVSAPITVNATTLGVTITGNPLGTPVPFAIVSGQPVTLTSRIADPRQLAVDPKTGVTVTPNYSYHWSLTRDGVPFTLPIGTVTNASTFTYTPTGGGLFLVSLAVSDGTLAAGADSVSQHVSAAPSAQIIVAPGTAVAAGTVVNLQAVVIDAALRRSLTYSWTVTSDNTQSTLTGTNTTGLFVFTPNAAGNYTVNLTVTDDLGRTGVGAPVRIRVSAAVPTVTVFGAPVTVAPGSSIALTGAATDADPNRPGSGSANIYTLSWSTNTTAGTVTPATGTGASYSFVASAAGTVVVTLTATDQNGVKTSTLTVINVAAPAGALTVTPSANPTQGQSLTWTASLNPAVAGTVYSWQVFSPDGVTSTFNTGTTNTLTLTNAQPGRYDVTVTATTPSGNVYMTTAPATGTFVVVPHAPMGVAVIVVPPVTPRINFQEGDTVNLTSTATESGVDLTNLSKASYLWTVTGPNGFFQVGVLPTLSVSPLAAGTYTATLTVRDFTGASGTGSATFAVIHVPPQPTLRLVDIGTDGTIGFQAVVSNPGGLYRFTYTVSLNGQLYLAATAGGSAYTFRIPPLSTLGSVTVSVTDSAGATGQLSATIQAVAAGTAANPVAKTIRASDFLPGTTTAIILAQGFNTITVDPTLPDTNTVEFIAVGARNVFTGGRTTNIFQGDSGNNVLNGGIGANTFYASGNDTLNGGAGANRIVPVTVDTSTGNVLNVTAGSGANTIDLSQQNAVSLNLSVLGSAQSFDALGNKVLLSGVFQSVLGTAGSDTLTAASGANISGGGGNDLLQSFNASNITLSASSGQATFNVTGGSNVLLLGGKDTNLLSVIGTQNATLIGGSGNNDSLIAGVGSKYVSLVGGSGNNASLLGLGANLSLIGGSGNNNSLVAGAGSVNVSLIGGSGNNASLLGLGANLSLIGGSGNNNSLIAGAGSKYVSLVGGSGSNDSLLALGANVSLIGGSGSYNSLIAGAGSVNVSLFGGSGNNASLVALSANASLVGGSGNNNSLVAGGGSSNVSLVGGSGNNNSLIAGAGSINVSLIGGSGNSNSLVAGAGSQNISLIGGSGSSNSLVALSANVSLFGGSGNNNSLVAGGGSRNVSLVGGSGNYQSLVSELGAVNVLAIGGSGSNDSLIAHGPNVSLIGGSGNNNSLVAGSSAVNVSLIGGSGNNNSLLAQSGALNILAIGGSGSNNSLVGHGGNVSLVGGSGNNNSLVAGAGAVNILLVGGSGNHDSLIALAGSTNVSLIGGSGNSNSLVAGAGSANVSLVGGSGDRNSLVASGSLTLRNLSGGSDTLIAGAANVSLVGGSGSNNSLVGTRGVVSLIGGSGGNTTLPGVSGATNLILLGGSGNNNSLVVGAGSVNVSLVGGSGNNNSLIAGANSVNVSLIGGSGNNNSLVAGAGSVNVSLIGGSGNNDSLIALGGGTAPSSNVSLIGGSGSGLLLSVTDTNGAILIGGFGDRNLLSASGTTSNVILIGGFGNDDSLTAGSGVSNGELIGGFGNFDYLSATGSNNLVLVGGFGNYNTLTASGGSNLTLLGGYGSFDSLSAANVTNAYLLGQSGHNDSLVSMNGTNVSLVGGSGSNLYLSDTGSTHVSLLGGSGNNDSLISVNGTNVTLFGGNGANDSISATGGINVLAVGGTSGGHSINAINLSNATLFGGAGNFNRIATTGSTNVLSVGGTGYGNSLSDTNGSADTIVNGGNQLSSLLASGGDTVRLFGGGGTDYLSAIGGSKIGLFGENGDNTYIISGTAANPFSGYLDALGTVGLDQSSTDQLESGMNTILFPVSDRVILDLSLSVGGAATASTASAAIQQVSTGVSFYLIGLFQGVVGSATGNDFIQGNALPDSLVAGGGNSTLMTGAGGGTLVAGSGNDLLVGNGRTTYAFRGAASGHATISQSDVNNADTIDLSKLSGPATLNLASTADQAVTSSLLITLVNPTNSDVIGSAAGNSIIGNSRDNHITLSTGNNTITTGSGLTTLKYTGSSLGTNTVTTSAPQSVGLNFHQLGAPLSINLANATQAVAGGTISFAGATDGRAVASVVGTVFNDTLLGNPNLNAPGVSLYGGSGRDSIVAGSGDDFLLAGVPQLVFLDFDTYTPLSINSHVYTQYERDAIQQRMEGVYSAFRSTITDPATSRTYLNGFVFTQSLASARLLTRGTGGEFVTLYFNKPPVGGQADQVDFGNADLGGSASVNASLILGRANQPDPTTANYIAETAGLAEHELAHLAGLRHTDSFGPIGSGGYQVFLNGTQVAGLNPNHYFPIYQQPATALAINASANPILADTSIPAGATAYGYETALHVSGSPASVGITRYDTLNNLFFGEREAIRLAFDQSGVTILAQAAPHGAAVVAQDLGTLPGLVVPNTLAAGSLHFGKSFAVTALAVVGSIGLDANGQSRSDWYSFAGRSGDFMSFETISHVLPGNPLPLDTIIRVYDSAGNLLAMNDDELESKDSLIQDFLVTADGKYFVQVDTYAENPSQNTSQGHYILSITGFQIGASLGGGSTLVAGPGRDILYGGQGNNLFRMTPNIAGSVTVLGGNGADVLDQSAAPLETVTYIPSANSAPISRIYANPPAIAFPAVNIAKSVDKGGQLSFSAALTGFPGRGIVYSLATVTGSQYPTGATIRGTDGTFNWAAGDQGSYQVRIVATASDGSSATTTLTITVNVVPPLLTPLTAQTAPVGIAVALTGRVAKPVATDTYLYGWVVTNSAGQTVATAGSQTLSFDPGISGVFTATVTVTDTQDGQTSSTATAITITEVTPIVAPLPSGGVKAGENTNFTASYLYPGSAASLALSWTVTNAAGQSVSTGTGLTFQFAAPDAGVYTVTFSVRTASGVTGSASATVTATGVPPTATPPAGVSLSEGTTVALAFTNPYSPASAVTAAGFRYSFAVSPALLATTYAAAGTSASFNFAGADVGTFTIYGRITDKNNQFTDYATPVVVTAVQLVPTGGGSFTAIKNSSTGALTLATFTDPGGADATTTYAASIDWGDGTAATTGSVALSGSTFSVLGSHTYATQGSYTVRVSLAHDGLTPVVVSDSVTVSAPALIGTGGFTPSGTKAADTGTVTLATFTDPTGPDALATYSASITWGDSTTSVGAISSPDANGKYTVTGNHTYTTTGTKTVVVTLRHLGSPDATATDTATIINPVLVARGVGIAATRNSPTGQVTVATFIDPAGPDVLANYSATVNWGDGSTISTATITLGSDGRTFSVASGHTYAAQGSYPITVTVAHGAAPPAPTVATTTATVSNPAVSPIFKPFVGIQNTALTNQRVATFTDPSGADVPTAYTATINWGDGTATTAGTIGAAVSGVFGIAGSHTYTTAGTFTVTITVVHGSSPPASTSGTVTINNGMVTATGTTASFVGALPSTAVVATFTDPNGAGLASAYSAVIAWGDGQSSAGLIANPVSGVFSVSGTHTYFYLGTVPISVTITRGTSASATVTSTANVGTSIFALNPTLSGAVSLSGSPIISIGGALVIDSNSNSALVASGSPRITAGSIRIVGGYSTSGSPNITPTPLTHVATIADPLASLVVPVNPGGTPINAVISGSQTVTLNPGLYSQISISGSARVTLNPGVYVIAGNFTVSGSPKLTGNGVLLFMAGSSYLSSHAFGGISFSGSPTIALTPMSTGTYAGITIFQARDNNRAISFCGSAQAGINGFVYAPNALLTLTGTNTTVRMGIIVDRLSTSGSSTSGQTTGGTGTEDGNPAGELLSTNLHVYVNDPFGHLTAAERERIHDAIVGIDTLTAPYLIDVVEVTNSADANVVIDLAATSILGGVAQGVLAAFDPTKGEITLIDGWNWYDGAAPESVGAAQFDFQTVVTHELGHALGLRHMPILTSVMYGSLTPGLAKRSLIAADLNVGNEDGLPGALHADLSGLAFDVTVSPVRFEVETFQQPSIIDLSPRMLVPTASRPATPAPLMQMVALDFPRVPVSVPLVSRSESLLDPTPATATEQVSSVVLNFELTNQPPVVEFSAKPLPAVADNRQAERLDQALVVPTLLPPTAPASLTASPAEDILDTWPEMSHWLDMLEPVPVSAGFDGDNVDLVELVLFGVLTGAAAAIGGVRREDAKLPELRTVRPE